MDIDTALSAAATVYRYLRQHDYPRDVVDAAYTVWDALERASRRVEVEQ